VDGGATRRPALVVALGIGGILLIVLLVLLMGSCSGGTGVPDPSDAASGAPPSSAVPSQAPETTPAPETTLAPGATDDTTTEATSPPQSGQYLILYQVQEGEALLKIAQTFGTTRRNILTANEGMEERTPFVQPGDVIVVPVSSELSIEQVESIPGYQGPAA
jgi:LysM repeat protein